MMDSPGIEFEGMCKKFTQLSLSTATPLETTNYVLDQVLDHIAYKNNAEAFLKTEGIYRISGTEKAVRECYAKIQKDPNTALLKDQPEIIQNPHNIVGVLKKALLDTRIKWSPQALKALAIFQGAFQVKSQETKAENLNNTDLTAAPEEYSPRLFSQLIVDLIQCGAIEEAKLLHNLTHLGYLICQYQAFNKMTTSNMAIVMTPSLSALTMHQLPVDKNLWMIATAETIDPKLVQIAPQVHDTMIAAFSSEECFGLSFDKMYFSFAKALLEQKLERFSKPSSKQSVDKRSFIKNPPEEQQFPSLRQKVSKEERMLKTKSISLYSEDAFKSYLHSESEAEDKENHRKLQRSPSFLNSFTFSKNPDKKSQQTSSKQNQGEHPEKDKEGSKSKISGWKRFFSQKH
mgnify:CR=1 FL=1